MKAPKQFADSVILVGEATGFLPPVGNPGAVCSPLPLAAAGRPRGLPVRSAECGVRSADFPASIAGFSPHAVAASSAAENPRVVSSHRVNADTDRGAEDHTPPAPLFPAPVGRVMTKQEAISALEGLLEQVLARKRGGPKTRSQQSMNPSIQSRRLLALGTIIADNQVATALGSKAETLQAHAVIAGVLSAAHVLLSAAQFRALLAQCQIDLCTLAEMFELARAKSGAAEDGGGTEVQHFLEFVQGAAEDGNPKSEGPKSEPAIEV